MSIALDLLKSDHVGIREIREKLSLILKKKKPVIITERGVPVNVLLPYSDMMELLDIFEEISDKETVKTVQEGRAAIKSGEKGVPVSGLFRGLREKKA